MSNRQRLVRRAVFGLLAGIVASGLPTKASRAETRQAEIGSFQVAQLFGGSKKRSKEAAELNLRVDSVEQEIRNITGKLEELSFQLQQLQDQLRRMQEDNEFRFQELEGGGGLKRGDLRRQKRSTDLADVSGSASTPSQNHVLGQLPKELSEEDANTLGRTSNGPLDLTAIARGNATGYQSGDEPVAETPRAAISAGEPGQDYEAAYNRVLQGDYAESEKMFQSFLASYPDHHLAGNAQYWLGESLFARGLYREAADAFLKSYSEYPNSTKGPDSLLKLGLALAGLGEQAAACATYGELLTKFPEAPASVKKRASVESSVIGCPS